MVEQSPSTVRFTCVSEQGLHVNMGGTLARALCASVQSQDRIRVHRWGRWIDGRDMKSYMGMAERQEFMVEVTSANLDQQIDGIRRALGYVTILNEKRTDRTNNEADK